MAEVYWIHLPEHTDMFTEGYIGITSKTAKERFKTHLKDSKRNDRPRSVINNAVFKYKDVLIVETLLICTPEYASEVEAKLRPSPRIGWNLAPGGGDVTSLVLLKRSKTHSEESIRKMSEIHTKLWSDHRVERLAGIARRRVPMEVPLDEDGNQIKFWITKKFTRPTSNKQYWAKAQELRDIYDDNPNISSTELLKHLNLPLSKKQWFQILIRYFDGGWIPNKDPLWLEDFDKEDSDVPRTMAA